MKVFSFLFDFNGKIQMCFGKKHEDHAEADVEKPLRERSSDERRSKLLSSPELKARN